MAAITNNNIVSSLNFIQQFRVNYELMNNIQKFISAKLSAFFCVSISLPEFSVLLSEAFGQTMQLHQTNADLTERQEQPNPINVNLVGDISNSISTGRGDNGENMHITDTVYLTGVKLTVLFTYTYTRKLTLTDHQTISHYMSFRCVNAIYKNGDAPSRRTKNTSHI